MTQPNALILRAPGTNCNVETAFAFECAGAATETLHVNRVLDSPDVLRKFQMLCVPGGFSYGDDLGAGRILGSQIQSRLADHLREFRDAGKLILGICNGFQVLMKSGLLVENGDATLAWNSTGKFQDRWVRLSAETGNCVFLKGISSMYLPIAHAEGRFVTRGETILRELAGRGQLALRYASQNGAVKAGSLLPWPDNPNGAVANVAGMCDATGRVFGLMPHPERYIDRLQHPRWTRGEGADPGDGLQVFQNAVAFFN